MQFNIEEDTHISDELLESWIAQLDDHINSCPECSEFGKPLNTTDKTLISECYMPHLPVEMDLEMYDRFTKWSYSLIVFSVTEEGKGDEPMFLSIQRDHLTGQVKHREWDIEGSELRRGGPYRIEYDEVGNIIEIEFSHPDDPIGLTFWEFYEMSTERVKEILITKWLPYA